MDDRINTEISLAFWLAKPLVLYEIINTIPESHPHYSALIQNALIAILELGCNDLAQKIADELNIALPTLSKDPIWMALEEGDLEKSASFFEKYSVKELCTPSKAHLLYGIYLWITEGKEIGFAHFSAALESLLPSFFHQLLRPHFSYRLYLLPSFPLPTEAMRCSIVSCPPSGNATASRYG